MSEELMQEEIDRLQGEVKRLRAGGRHILAALFGAADRGGWSRDNIHNMADYLAQKYPWADPRRAADAAGGEDE